MSVAQMVGFAVLVGIFGGGIVWFLWNVLENLMVVMGEGMRERRANAEAARRKAREEIEEEVREGQRKQKA